jgi:hypothetical protein
MQVIVLFQLNSTTQPSLCLRCVMMHLLPHNFNIISVSTVYLSSSKVTIYVHPGVTLSVVGEVVT